MVTGARQVNGRRIREIRQLGGWEQQELAARAEISKQHLSDIELGKTNASPPVIKRLADALQVTVRDISNFEEGPA